ncbi:hypothetical protein CR513_01362, partial [Mucuna pruriens]
MLKSLVKGRFFPPFYTRDLHNKLQRLYQGSRSVEKYHKEMEMDLMKAQIREGEEATMARFLHGLNKEIKDVMDLQCFSTLGELVHQAIKVEMQIRRRSAFRKSYVYISGWKGKEREKEKGRREKSPKKGSDPSLGRKETTSTPTLMAPRISDIKCFKFLGKGHIALQCPNRKVVIMKYDKEVESESSLREISFSSEAKSLSDDFYYKGDLLVLGRLMNSHVGEEAETQRENIFHSRCLISYLINGGIIEKGEFLVDKQIDVTFTVGEYEDKVTYDVVPIQVTHLLLGRPWQFDKRVIHDGVTNRFTFVHLGQRVVLKPLSPREIHEDKKK